MLAEILPKIAAAERPADRELPYRPRPSLAGPERCLRQLVYNAAGAPRAPLAGRAVLVFDDSSWHEELTADWIRKTAYQLSSQQMEVECPPPIGHGHIDGVLTDLLGVDRLWEHKAINHFTFERIWRGDLPLDYLTQVALYIHGLQGVNPAITEGLLLVKNKNTSAYLEFLCRYDRQKDELLVVEGVRSDGQRIAPGFRLGAVVSDAVLKFEAVADYAARGTLPPRPFEFGTDFPCGYCPWAETCWAGYEEEFEAREGSATLSEIAAERAGEYLELNERIRALEAAKDEIKGELKDVLAAANAKSGRAGRFTVGIRLQARTSLDKDLLPPELVTAATKTTYSEVFTVRASKGGAA